MAPMPARIFHVLGSQVDHVTGLRLEYIPRCSYIPETGEYHLPHNNSFPTRMRLNAHEGTIRSKGEDVADFIGEIAYALRDGPPTLELREIVDDLHDLADEIDLGAAMPPCVFEGPSFVPRRPWDPPHMLGRILEPRTSTAYDIPDSFRSAQYMNDIADHIEEYARNSGHSKGEYRMYRCDQRYIALLRQHAFTLLGYANGTKSSHQKDAKYMVQAAESTVRFFESVRFPDSTPMCRVDRGFHDWLHGIVQMLQEVERQHPSVNDLTNQSYAQSPHSEIIRSSRMKQPDGRNMGKTSVFENGVEWGSGRVLSSRIYGSTDKVAGPPGPQSVKAPGAISDHADINRQQHASCSHAQAWSLHPQSTRDVADDIPSKANASNVFSNTSFGRVWRPNNSGPSTRPEGISMTTSIEDALTGIEERPAAISVLTADLRSHLQQPASTVSQNDGREPQHAIHSPGRSSIIAELGSDYEVIASENGTTMYSRDPKWEDEGVTIASIDDTEPLHTPTESVAETGASTPREAAGATLSGHRYGRSEWLPLNA